MGYRVRFAPFALVLFRSHPSMHLFVSSKVVKKTDKLLAPTYRIKSNEQFAFKEQCKSPGTKRKDLRSKARFGPHWLEACSRLIALLTLLI